MHPHLKTLSLTVALLVSPHLPILLSPHLTPPASAQTVPDQKVEADRLLKQGNDQMDLKKFEAALKTLQQALQIYQSLNDRSGAGQTLKSLGNVYYAQKDYERAAFYQQEALRIAQDLQDSDLASRTLLNLGNIHKDLGNLTKAIDQYQQSLAIARANQFKEVEWKALDNLGNAYFQLDKPEQAIEFYQQALRVTEELQDIWSAAIFRRKIAVNQSLRDPRSVEGKRLLDQGLAQLNQKQFQAAIQSWQQALTIYQETAQPYLQTRALVNLGYAYDSLRDYPNAVEFFQQAADLAEEVQDYEVAMNALNRMALIYHDVLGQQQQAISTWARLINVVQQAKHPNRDKLEALSLQLIGIAYARSGKYPQEIQFLTQSLQLSQKLGDQRAAANTLTLLGYAQLRLGKHRQAFEFARQVFVIGQQLQDEEVMVGAIRVRAIVHGRVGNIQQAISDYQNLLNHARKTGDRSLEAQSLNNMGNIYGQNGQHKQAISLFQQVLRIAPSEIGYTQSQLAPLIGISNSFRALGDYPQAIQYGQQAVVLAQKIGEQSGAADALNNLGVAFFYAGNFAEAERSLFRSMQIRESLRVGLPNLDQVAIFEEQKNVYANLQKTLIAQNKPEQALEVAERGRARAFVELLMQRAGSPPTSLQKGGAKPIFQNSPFEGGQGGSRSLVAQAASAAKPIVIADIKQIAQEQNATLVEYSIIGGESLYIWVVKPTGEIAFEQVDLKSLPQDEGKTRLQTLIDASRSEDLSARGRSITFTEDLATVSDAIARIRAQENTFKYLQQLHKLLIEPISQHLPSDPNQRVIFMPQGELFFVPFPALQTADGKFLIEKHTITTSPAIQVLQLTRQQRLHLAAQLRTPHSALRTLIVGNPTMPKIGNPPQQLSSLPGAENEAKAIAALINAQAIVGGQATKSAIVQQMQTARIIHLATHGLLDDYKGLGVPGAIALAPDEGRVALAPDSPTSLNSALRTPHSALLNGLLTASEILDMKLQADLVVLSACDTGRGKITGDGVIGLSRSLISAGTPSIIVSLWKVPDDSTSFLMQEFYKILQQGKVNKAQALRQAMLITLKQYPEPKDWAAFTLIGEAE